jgi:hypothetical protein
MAIASETLQNLWQKPHHNPWEQAHPCPNCGRTMQLTRSGATSSGVSGFHSYGCYGCAECGIWAMEADEE